MNREVEEALLEAWMEMALHIRGNRLVDGLSFNETVICSMLYRNQMLGKAPLTATDLVKRTGLLKSQLNKVLNAMEYKGLIMRKRDEKDKRKVYLMLCEEKQSVYLTEHEKVMKIVHQVCSSMGEEKAGTLSALLTEAVDALVRSE